MEILLFNDWIPNRSADLNIMNGTEKILIRLIMAVSDIDKATSPFANFVKTLDVTLLSHVIIITPKASSNGDYKF